MTLDYTTERGAGSEQTCFDVIDMEVVGSGFQRFSDAAHGVTVAVRGPDGSEVDADDIFPGADGTFRIVLHTAPYAPGTYTLAARYSFVSANAVTTQILTDGFQFDID